MLALLMRRKLVWIVLTIIVTFAAWFCLPRDADLRGFDAAAMAKIETNSWRHYYEKRWVMLFADLYAGARDQYGFSPRASCALALHAARAAKVFQASHSREEATQAIPLLANYFDVIRSEISETFDVATAAKLELEWWQLRRENKTWQEYGRAVAAATAVLYSLPSAALEPASLKRAEMMDVRDHWGKANTEDDWRQIETGLREAWSLCKAAVTRRDG